MKTFEQHSNTMKKWCLTTTSESSDHYIYFIENPTKPTIEELKKFLFEQGNDRDYAGSYENIDDCVEIKDFKKLIKRDFAKEKI